LVTAVAAVPIVIQTSQIYNIWYGMGSVLVPILLLPLVISYLKRDLATSKTIITSMLVSGAVSLGQYIYGRSHMAGTEPQYIWGIEPMYSGLIVSAAIVLISLLLHKRT
ncbi:MAG TPA: hypothetical protein VFH43_11855, partial [Candidatus Kapabacteria bacterium]|nr:hypothetical protein [Candidatus Kapabacteria bacterium]